MLVLQAHVSMACDVYSPCPALFTRMSMPPGSKRSTSWTNACSSGTGQLSSHCDPKSHVTGNEQAKMLRWAQLGSSPVQPQPAW